MADYPRVAGASVAFLLDSEKILFSFRTFAKEEKSRATEKDALLNSGVLFIQTSNFEAL